MNQLLLDLLSGAKHFNELLHGRSEQELYIQLDYWRKRDKICKDSEGRWKLRTPPPKDRPLPVETRISHPCKHCGGPVYIARGVYCSSRCHALGKTKPKPNCRRCGNPVQEIDHKYCSHACRWERGAA